MLQAVLATLLLITAFSPAKASLPENFFGIMSQENPTLQETRLMDKGGVETYRIPMSWDSVQSSAGAPFNWEWVDKTMGNLARANIEALPIMMATPKGLSKDFRTLPIYTKEQRSGWNRYLKEAIERYGPSGAFWRENPALPYRPIKTWQVWNEANFVWFSSPVSPKAYLALLKNSFQVIKREDPSAEVMLASLFARPIKEQGIDSTVFLKKIYSLGAKKYFDSAALHPYSKDTKEMSLMIERVRRVMSEAGDKRAPLHITEVGWGSGKATAFDRGSPRAQAKELTKAYSYLASKQKKLNIGSVFWFSWKDLPSHVESCDFCYSSGLFYPGSKLRAKPAWGAFQKATRLHRG